ncbi:unnamed protein product, partial [Prorocentrum cordatum]
ALLMGGMAQHVRISMPYLVPNEATMQHMLDRLQEQGASASSDGTVVIELTQIPLGPVRRGGAKSKSKPAGPTSFGINGLVGDISRRQSTTTEAAEEKKQLGPEERKALARAKAAAKAFK